MKVSDEHPIKQPIKSISIHNEFQIGTCYPESYTVGHDDVTRIDATMKSGMYSNIPYIVVWKGEVAFAEFCQHNIIGVYFETEKLAE